MRIRYLVLLTASILLVSTAGSGPPPGPIDLRAIPSGSSIRVEYRSDGCFHGEGWLIRIEPGSPPSAQVELLDRVSQEPKYSPVALQPRHLERLANLLAYYRSERAGDCSTHERVDITYETADGTKFTEFFQDNTCGTMFLPNLLDLWTLVRWSEGHADPDAPKELHSLGTVREILERSDK